MQTKCPHCDKGIQAGAIVCPHCSSYVVQMEERKRRWHLFAIPLIGVAVVAGILFYMDVKEQEMLDKRQATLEAERPVDRTVTRQHERAERERQRKTAYRDQIRAKQLRKSAERKANEAWRALPTKDKQAKLHASLSELRGRIGSLKKSASGDATVDFHTFLTKLETRIAAADTFIDAEQFDSARGLINGAIVDLESALGEGQEKGSEPEAAGSVKGTSENEVASP
jgi:hypothetical protein